MPPEHKVPGSNPGGRTFIGIWRSLVAHLTGGQGAAGSNPAIPTFHRIINHHIEQEVYHDCLHRQSDVRTEQGIAAHPRGQQPCSYRLKVRTPGFQPDNESSSLSGSTCGCSSVGRASGCQSGGHGFESRHPLHSFHRRLGLHTYAGIEKRSSRRVHTPVRKRSGFDSHARIHILSWWV